MYKLFNMLVSRFYYYYFKRSKLPSRYIGLANLYMISKPFETSI